jgi:hypothetical protein
VLFAGAEGCTELPTSTGRRDAPVSTSVNTIGGQLQISHVMSCEVKVQLRARFTVLIRDIK